MASECDHESLRYITPRRFVSKIFETQRICVLWLKPTFRFNPALLFTKPTPFHTIPPIHSLSPLKISSGHFPSMVATDHISYTNYGSWFAILLQTVVVGIIPNYGSYQPQFVYHLWLLHPNSFPICGWWYLFPIVVVISFPICYSFDPNSFPNIVI